MSFYNKIGNLKRIFDSGGKTDDQRLKVFCGILKEALNGENGEDPKLQLEDMSITEIFHAVPPSAFPVVTGELISKRIIDAYNLQPTIGDQLTTRMPSKLMIDRIPGFAQTGEMKAIAPGFNYQHTGFIEEKWAQIEGEKFGKILDIVEETILFDQTGQILMVAGRIGEGAAMFKEKMILNTIQDITDYKAWYPGVAGVATQTDLYSNTEDATHRHDNLINDNLVDHTDINAALLMFSAMQDENGDPILINVEVMLVPKAKLMTAQSIYNSTVIIGGANSQPNPYAGKFKPLSSPFLDIQSAVAWYIGDFKKQFVYKEVIPIQVLTRRDKYNDMAWERDVIAQYKVRMYGKPGAVDFPYVVKSLGTT